jgi:hypothetical protein
MAVMNPTLRIAIVALSIWAVTSACHGQIKVIVDRNDTESATAGWQFKAAPLPCRNDAATQAKFTIVDGRQAANSGDLDKLHDGKVPVDEDQPSENFFFDTGSDGGRILVDLVTSVEIRQVNTYSWHPSTRGPQVYRLYAAIGDSNAFNPQPRRDLSPEACGWKLIADVDTRPGPGGSGGGQTCVSISGPNDLLGTSRFLLFDIRPTERSDPFGNTFFSEIDVVDRHSTPEPVTSSVELSSKPIREVVETDGGTYQITIDTTETPDLTDWVHRELAPVVREWYPRITLVLASDGFKPPAQVRIIFRANGQAERR